jgi:ribonuclease H2 subunit A
MLHRLFDCSPQAISSGMLRRPPTNLNRQSEEATVLLIREIIQSGIQLSEVLCPFVSVLRAHSNRNVQVFVDALGTTTTYEAYLSSLFPGISFTVATKADSKFKIVGAASVAAKVTRDACLDGWVFEEASSSGAESPWSAELGSGYPSGVLAVLAF